MSTEIFADSAVALIVGFLRAIGIPVQRQVLAEPTFLPGILIQQGGLVIDAERLLYPGDLLHEAGHIAVSSPERRAAMVGNAGPDPAEEMMAIAWSYAAAVHLQLDPRVVFHAHGYRGGGDNMVENFTQGRYVGVPMLQWLGMTYESQQASQAGVPPYPHMIQWLRDR